jgi:hypothetical protein
MGDEEIYLPEDTITSGETTDPVTGATVSPDGSSVVFPDDTIYPSGSAQQERIEAEIKDMVPDLPPPSDPIMWPEADPSSDPIFGTAGADPDDSGS